MTVLRHRMTHRLQVSLPLGPFAPELGRGRRQGPRWSALRLARPPAVSMQVGRVSEAPRVCLPPSHRASVELGLHQRQRLGEGDSVSGGLGLECLLTSLAVSFHPLDSPPFGGTSLVVKWSEHPCLTEGGRRGTPRESPEHRAAAVGTSDRPPRCDRQIARRGGTGLKDILSLSQ